MSKPLSRRRFVQTITATGAAVLGFDSVTRAWVTAPPADPQAFDQLPPLDGALTYDRATLAEFADDYGHIIHHLPSAVLHPASVEDVVKVVRYANRHNIKVAMSGNHHATYGQSQAESGIVINSRALNRVVSVDGQSATVQTGALWTELLRESLRKGLAPPVLTEYQQITVGGTLSVGGIGVASPRLGSQGDHVLGLDLVTGDGRLVSCSPRRNGDLFYAALGGLGQCGIIVGAKLKLSPAPTYVATYDLTYDDLDTYLRDAALIAREFRYEHQQGGPAIQKDGSWKFILEASKLYGESSPPDFKALEAGLRFTSKGKPQISTYWEYLHRTTKRVAAGRHIPHPRIEVFVPASKAKGYITHILRDEAFYVGGAEFPKFRIFGYNSRPFGQGLLQVPRGEAQFFVVGLLRAAPVGDEAALSRMVDNNHAWVERAHKAGGGLYPISSVAMTPADWRAHFGRDWQRLSAAKRKYDPNKILAPGQGIFPDSGAAE